MIMWLYILVGIVASLLLYAVVTYNAFIRLSNKVREAFATMDVYLKKRWDLIPNIVEAVKGYAQHEKDALERVTVLRSGAYHQMSSDDKIDVNEQITSGMSRLMMVAENYPDLKANENFLDLSKQLSKAENDIANSRKYYNAVVRNMNNKVQMFPSNVVASWFGFKEMKMFEAFETERGVVNVVISD